MMPSSNTENEMEREFVSMITHQLKTPLAEIHGFVENMLEGLTGALNEKQKEVWFDSRFVCGCGS